MNGTPKPFHVPATGLFPGPVEHGFDLLRQIRKTPMVLYGIFTELTQQFYSNVDNLTIGTPQKPWTPNPDTTKIWIDTELRWNDDHPEMRPAIYIKLGPLQYVSLTGRSDGLAGGNLRSAEEYYSRSGTGSVSFVHLAGSAGEACLLGDATHDYLDAFSKQIRDDFCFTKFFLQGRVPLADQSKESKERYQSTVTCSFEFQDRWTIKLESQRLKSVTMRAGQHILESGIVR